MRAGLRLPIASIALALGFAAAPAGAQNQAAPATSAPPPATAPAQDVIGPAQLQDFSLKGTVTRRAEPRETQPQPAQQPATARAAPPPADSAGAPSRQVASRPEPAAPQPRETAQAAPQPSVAAPAGPDFSIFGAPPTAADPAAFAPDATLPPPPTDLGEDSGGFSPLPWILALLGAGAAAAFYFLRQRPRLAAAGGVSEFVAPEPEPQPRPVPEPLRRAPVVPPAPQGVVSTRLRPWLDIAFAPDRCDFTDTGATIEFAVTVTNSGSAPARDVLVEAAAFNAGTTQDKDVGAFFQSPVGQGDRVPAIAPLKSIALRHRVTLSREQLRVYQAGERSVFVPILAFNALYRHGGGESQTSAAWLVGRETSGDKMAPFRADQGPRAFAGLAARPLEPHVRN